MHDTIIHDGDAARADDASLLHEAEDRDRAAALFRERVMPGRSDELAVAIAHAAVSTWNTSTLARVLRASERA